MSKNKSINNKQHITHTGHVKPQCTHMMGGDIV